MKNMLQEKRTSNQINILYVQPITLSPNFNKQDVYKYQDLIAIGKTNGELNQLFPKKNSNQQETVFTPHNQKKVNHDFNFESSMIETACLDFYQANVSFSVNPLQKYKQAKLLFNQIEQAINQNAIVITGNFGPFDSMFYIWFQKKLDQFGIVSVDPYGSNIFYSKNKLECSDFMRGFDDSSIAYLVNGAKLKIKK